MAVKVVEKKAPIVEEQQITTIPNGYHEVTNLPSKMKLYKEGTKIYSRALKLSEVKKLSTISAENFNEVINSVLSDTIYGIEVADLILADKFYIIFWQRANTYRGDGFSVEFRCPSCEATSNYDFDITAIEVKDIVEDYDPNKQCEIGEHTYNIGQMTVRDENLLLNYSKNNKGKNLDEDILLLSAVISSIDGTSKTLADKYELISNLDPASFVKLNNEYKKYEMSVLPMMKVKCKTCGEVVETPINFRSEFFLPTA